MGSEVKKLDSNPALMTVTLGTALKLTFFHLNAIIMSPLQVMISRNAHDADTRLMGSSNYRHTPDHGIVF